ncbi:MAG: hypothetical protein NC038_05795 [Paludibacter sp.]|nr:hypothetical protein [Bacteroidales bacterium]MCM1068781.1 hypothetical protein [Prevotella sp.]MCM1353922.1 hypothetical protein [Bacteroides sp.]MCM1443320.1 hypothetical protein [Muribaculum sp.]MCM1482139.1 hypothetical protein [Paludibacter sp.]
MRNTLNLISILLVLVVGMLQPLRAQTALTEAHLSVPTYISPYYFGPNAFPIPDMLDGTVSHDLRIEVSSSYFKGFAGDRTADIAFKVNIPLFTDRVNLTLWLPAMEWYANTLERQRICRLQDTLAMRGREAGDAYISTDIQVLRQRRYLPDITIRAAVKTASGGGFAKARYYDCPGYWFDATLAKSLLFNKSTFFEELRFAASAGFLCWQTDNGRQNDAVMYGAMLQLKTRYFLLSEVFGGYAGWENHPAHRTDAHDCPMSLKTTITGYYKHFELLFMYQYGLQDYPFHQFRIGVAYNVDILGAWQRRKLRKEM